MTIVYINKTRMDDPIPSANFSLMNVIGLAQAGASVIFYAQKKDPLLSTEDLHTRFKMTIPANLDIRMMPIRKFLGFKSNQIFYLDVLKSLKKQLKNGQIDAVISRDPGALPYLKQMKKQFGVKVFYQPHNFYLDLSIRPDVSLTNARKYQVLEKTYLSRMDGLLCLQQSQADLYKKYLPDQSVYTSEPGFLEPFEPDLDRFAHPVIGYTGSLQPKKGVATLLEACHLLHTDGIPFSCVLIGGRNEEEIQPAKDLITYYALEKQVSITGWIPYAEVKNWLRTVTVGVLPLTDEFYNRYLTAPNKLFDYMSWKIPVIASDLPAIRDFISDGEAGLLIQPDHPEKLRNALYEVLTNETLYRKLENGMFVTSQNFKWSHQGQKMIELISGKLNRN